MAKAGRISGRGMGRPGARVGLPRDAVPRDGRAAPTHGPSHDYALGSPRDGETRRHPAPPPRPPLSGGWPDEPITRGDGSRIEADREVGHEERLAVARLFDHLDRDTPRPYREDAYQDAPRITHSGRVRFALSGGSLSALIAGGVVSLLLIFVAGFMSAVLIFGEPDPDGQIAIRTAPSAPATASEPTPVQAPSDAVADTGPVPASRPAASNGTVVSTAEATRDVLPPPSPEIVAAEAARQNALGPSPETAPTPPVTETDLAATRGADPQVFQPPPQSTAPERAQGLGAEGMVDATIIFPPNKPTPPTRVAAADPATPARLGAPGGNYSLQFGAFQARANAEALVRELSASIDAGIVEEVGATGATLFHVRAGSFDTRAAALRTVRALRDDAGLVTFVHANRGTG